MMGDPPEPMADKQVQSLLLLSPHMLLLSQGWLRIGAPSSTNGGHHNQRGPLDAELVEEGNGKRNSALAEDARER
jgi:hypothetical protein